MLTNTAVWRQTAAKAEPWGCKCHCNVELTHLGCDEFIQRGGKQQKVNLWNPSPASSVPQRWFLY